MRLTGYVAVTSLSFDKQSNGRRIESKSKWNRSRIVVVATA